MESLLQVAEKLERRDGHAAAELAQLERNGREIEDLRAAAEAAAGFLAGLPSALAAVDTEVAGAASARSEAASEAEAAEARLARTEQRGSDEERLAAARAARHARDALREAELRAARAGEERARLEREGDGRRREAVELERRAQALAERLGALPRVAHEAGRPPRPGLEGVRAWAAQARGALLVAEAGIEAERDRVAREATELWASVTGDPLVLAGVPGIRDRLARALGGPRS